MTEGDKVDSDGGGGMIRKKAKSKDLDLLGCFYDAANANVLEQYTQKPAGYRYRQDYYPRPGHRGRLFMFSPPASPQINAIDTIV